MSIEEFVSTPAVKLTELTGISEAQWSHYFNDNRSPSLRTISSIAKTLEMSPGDMAEALLQRLEIHAKTSQALSCYA
jgi:transcriptional regulator with XRE-family HTH domain